MSKTMYKKAIEIIHSREYDAEKICSQLAQNYPSLFVKFSTLPQNSLEQEIIALGRKQLKIQAIALYREKTNTDLRTAKDAVEQIFDKYGISDHRVR